MRKSHVVKKGRRKMYQLIAFDMDGTLLNSQKQILPSSREAIAKASRAGKTVILNTGRCLAEVAEYLPLIPQVRYLNCVSGALVHDLWEHKTLFTQHLSPDMTGKLLELGMLEKAMPHILTEKSIVQRSHWEHIERYGMAIYQDLYDHVAEKWEDIVEEYQRNPFPAAKVNLYHTSPESRTRTESRIKAVGLQVATARADTTSLEISAQGVNKGVGLENLCRYLHLPLSQVIVVGDADNDREALEKAGLAVVMGNAEESIREKADAVVADCDHDGCAQAIESFLLEN